MLAVATPSIVSEPSVVIVILLLPALPPASFICMTLPSISCAVLRSIAAEAVDV